MQKYALFSVIRIIYVTWLHGTKFQKGHQKKIDLWKSKEFFKKLYKHVKICSFNFLAFIDRSKKTVEDKTIKFENGYCYVANLLVTGDLLKSRTNKIIAKIYNTLENKVWYGLRLQNTQ